MPSTQYQCQYCGKIVTASNNLTSIYSKCASGPNKGNRCVWKKLD